MGPFSSCISPVNLTQINELAIGCESLNIHLAILAESGVPWSVLVATVLEASKLRPGLDLRGLNDHHVCDV